MTQHLTSYQGKNVAEATAPRGRMTFDLMDPAAFQHIQRVAVMYANSPLFPEHLRKGGQQVAIANAILCMNIADRLKEDTLTVAQQIYFVGGKPGWAATYMIAKANQHGVFKNPIDWKVTGKKDELSVTAFAELSSTGKKVDVTVDMETARLEGWTRNSKYKSMPEQMLRYRSATALIRLYCPEVMIGVPPANEVEDQQYAMRDVTPEYPDEDEGDVTEDVVTEQSESEPKKVARQPVSRDRPEPAKKEPTPEIEDAVEGDDPKADEKAAVEAPAEKKPEPEKVEAKQTEKAKEPEPEKEEPGKDWNALRKAVIADLEHSSGDITGVVGFYNSDLTEMREKAKDVFDALEKEIGVDLSAEL